MLRTAAPYRAVRSPWTAVSSPTVATTFAATVAPESQWARRSRASPMSGPATRTTMTAATGQGAPH